MTDREPALAVAVHEPDREEYGGGVARKPVKKAAFGAAPGARKSHDPERLFAHGLAEGTGPTQEEFTAALLALAQQGEVRTEVVGVRVAVGFAEGEEILDERHRVAVDLELERAHVGHQRIDRTPFVEVPEDRCLVIETDDLTQEVLGGEATLGQKLPGRVPGVRRQWIRVGVGARQVVAVGARLAQHARFEWRAGVDLGATVAHRLRRVLAHEGQILAHGLQGGLGVEHDDGVLGGDAKLFEDAQGPVFFLDGLVPADRRKPRPAARFDAQEHAQKAHLAQA